MPFGLTNAPAIFENFINDALQPFQNRFATAYLEDILIYSDTLEEHKEHVRQALEQLQRHGLHLMPEEVRVLQDGGEIPRTDHWPRGDQDGPGEG